MSNVLKLGKKVFTVGVVFSTMLWSVGVSALLPTAAVAAACPTFASGDLLKVSGKPAIYAVDSNGKVLYFPTGDEFKSWNVNDSYGGYITVSQECYDSLPVPSMAPFGVNFRSGSYVVKRASSDQLYVVEPGNTLAKITAQAAAALYGANYKVMTVADVFWPNYVNRGADITEGVPHVGMLVSNGGKTWYVDAGNVLREVTSNGMSANRFKTAFVRAVSNSAIAGFTTGAVIDGAVSATADRTQSGGGSTVIPGQTGGALTVSLASNNPPQTTLASGTAFNPVLTVALSTGGADVSVTGLTVRRGGFLANSNITGVDVIDGAGVRHGNVATSLTADGDAILLFAGAPVTVRAGQPQTLTVRVNIASGATSGTVNFSVLNASVVSANGSVGGTFPVTGNTFTIASGSNSIAAATVNIAALNATGTNLSVDATNEQEIAKFQIAETGGIEAIKLSKLTLYNTGTAADTDVKDVQLVAQDGTVLATAQQVNKNVNFDLSAAPYLIDKGQTKNLTVRAKIVDGSSRTIQFEVYNNYDVVLVGANSNVSVLAITSTGGTSGTDNSFPVGNKTDYNKVTIAQGTLTFNKDTSSPSNAVAPNTNNVVLAKFYAKPTGENMELRQIGLGFVTGTTSTFTGSFTVKVNGASVYSAPAVDVVNSASSLGTLNLSTYPLLTAGVNNYITVEANINSLAVNGATSTVYMNLKLVRRMITNDIYSVNTSIAQGNQITVQAAALKVTNLATPVAQSVVPGTSGVTFANIELSASTVSSGEDVKVNRLVISDTVAGGAAVGDLANLALYVVDQNGNMTQLSTSASTATNAASNTFTLVNPIVIPKAGSVTLTLKADVIGNAGSGTHKFAVMDAANHVTATGKDTGNTVTPSAGFGAGQAMTITSAGTLTLSLVSGSSASPSSDQTVSVGATNVPVFAFKLSAQNEPVKVTSLKIMASGTINTVNDLVNLKLYRNNETTPFASAAQMLVSSSGSTTSTVFTWTATDNLLADAVMPGTPVTIYVKADVGAAGQAYLGDSFRFKINTTGDVSAKGQSGNSATISGTPTVTAISYIVPFGVTVTGVAPSEGSSNTQAVLAGTQLARVLITNNGSSKITVTGIKFTDSGAHSGSTTTYRLYFSDQNSSNYTGNTASSTRTNSVDFSDIATGGTTFTIDGGASRYVTVAIAALGSAVTGDNWQLSIASIGDVSFTATEADLGYDSNNSGSISGSSNTLYGSGKPTLGTLVKQ